MTKTAETKEETKEQIKLGNLVVSQAAFAKVLQIDFPATRRFQLKRLAKQITELMQDYEAARIELCDKYGAVEGSEYKFTPENHAKFNAELNALLNEPVKLDFEKMPSNEIDSISTADEIALEWLIVDEQF